MTEAPILILSLLAGAILGVIFFGGLWWTIHRALSSTRPAIWFLASLLLRTVLALSGFYLVSRGDWRKLAACLLGFLATRIAMTRLAREPVDKGPQAAQGGGP
jgi:F1F0 ATPase subunit 2